MRRRISALLLTLIMILSFVGVTFIPYVSSCADDTIIIAYNEDTNFIHYENGIFSGYGVEFLDEIAIYSKWHYKLLPCSNAEALKGLEAGSISLYFGVSDMNSLGNNYVISNDSIINIQFLLYTNPSDTRVWYDDISELNGFTIGFKSDSALRDKLSEYSEHEPLDFNAKSYTSYAILHQALLDGEIDAAACSSLNAFSDCKLVASYGGGPYYALTSKAHSEIMSAFNAAYASIKSRTPGFMNDLYTKYYDSKPISALPLYTRQEMLYIKSHAQFNVGLFPDNAPLSYIDSDNNFAGIFPHLLRRISQISGINFTPVELDNSLLARAQLSVDIPLAFGIGLSSKDIIDGSINFTLPLCNINNILVTSHNKSIDFSDATAIIPRSQYNIYHYLAIHYPNLRINYCETITEALDSVYHGDSDFTVVNEYVLDYYTKSAKYNRLFTDWDFDYDEQYVFIASPSTDSMLISVLDKTITHLNRTTIDSDLREIREKYQYQRTFFDILHTYSSQIIMFICLLSFIFLLLFLAIKDRALYKSAEIKAAGYKEKAEIDYLTGLSSYSYFGEQLGKLLRLSRPGSYSLTAIHIAKHHLITTIYGYKKYDDIVKYIADIIRNKMPELFGIATMYDSSTFMVMLPSASNPKDLFGENFLNEVAKYPIEHPIDIYVGVYNITDTESPAHVLYEKAISVASPSGGNNESHYMVYGSERDITLNHERIILDNIDRALRKEEFSFNIQPKINLDSGKIIGGEALIRWSIPDKGSISPDLFIPILEKYGFITRLDLYLLNSVCRLLRSYLDKGLPIVPISINLSECDFHMTLLAEEIVKICASYGIEHRFIEFEISEGVYNEHNKFIYAAVNNLRKEGFKVTMDDFGCEFSTVNMLKVAEIDDLKIDVRFIYKSDINNRADAIIRKIAELTSELGFNLVAEGVETREQAEFLKEVGCKVAQGFYYSMPLKLEDFETYMKTNI